MCIGVYLFPRDKINSNIVRSCTLHVREYAVYRDAYERVTSEFRQSFLLFHNETNPLLCPITVEGKHGRSAQFCYGPSSA